MSRLGSMLGRTRGVAAHAATPSAFVAGRGALLLGLSLAGVPALRAQAAPWQDPRRSPAERAQDLLARLTAEEKFWQLFLHPGDSASGQGPGSSRYGIQVRTTGTAADAARQLNAVQRDLMARSRLAIPMIPVEEALHGVTAPGATAFPQAIALAATWDTALMGQVATAIAREARARGIRQVLSPVVNLATDVRWGRTEETYGEDPVLASAMGRAFVAPFEAAGIVTTPKHFVANVGDGGRDSYPIEWSERRLLEEALPPFAALLRDGPSRSVMAAYNSVDGRPASASPWLLTDLLRQRWRSDAVVISDAGGVGGANVLHGTATDYADATAQAMRAGLDVIFQGDAASADLFRPPFLDGRLPGPVIDSAVARVLRLKFALGLFEAPGADLAAARLVDADTTVRVLARRVAERSAVLLKNDRFLLPLVPGRVQRVALIGADAAEGRLGGYSGPGRQVTTAVSALRARLSAEQVLFAPGPGRRVTRDTTIPMARLRSADGQPGLSGRYCCLDDPEGSTRQRVDPVLDFHWTFVPPIEGIPPDWFIASWTGTLVPDRTGVVHLGVEGTDGFRLWLGDSMAIDETSGVGLRRRTVPIRLVRGRPVPLQLDVTQHGPNGRLRLFWDAGVVDSSEREIRRAVAAALGADVAIVMVGLEEGEFRDRASLGLPGRQAELIHRVAATGTPVVVVLIGGSAVTMPWLDEVGAVLDLWYPGEAGGEALVRLLFGEANPSGRLPVTFPVAEGQLPLTYRHKPTGRGDDYVDLTGQPLFPFGFGLSYTTYDYTDLRIAGSPAEGLRVTCRVRNAGARKGDEVVQLYVRDPVASTARPVLALAAFARVSLAPGDSREVELLVPRSTFEVLGPDGTPRLEPGSFTVLVGSSSRHLWLRGEVQAR